MRKSIQIKKKRSNWCFRSDSSSCLFQPSPSRQDHDVSDQGTILGKENTLPGDRTLLRAGSTTKQPGEHLELASRASKGFFSPIHSKTSKTGTCLCLRASLVHGWSVFVPEKLIFIKAPSGEETRVSFVAIVVRDTSVCLWRQILSADVARCEFTYWTLDLITHAFATLWCRRRETRVLVVILEEWRMSGCWCEPPRSTSSQRIVIHH